MKAVRAERERLGWSQERMAQEMQWERKTVSRIETGERDIGAHELPTICRALGVDLRRLTIEAEEADQDALGL
jgi:transcriptional regulator with XRE-family HTH domain